MYTDHAPLVGLEKKDEAQIKNARIVGLLEKMTPYNIKIGHIKGADNSCADALSMQLLPSCDAEDIPRNCHGNMTYRINRAAADNGGEVREFREDIRRLAEIGNTCDEYRRIVQLLTGNFKVKELEPDHPARAYEGALPSLSVEETGSGPIVMVYCIKVFITMQERSRLI